MKSLLVIFILFLTFQQSSGQNIQNAEIDAVKYFDENHRWYNEFTEHWFQFFDIPESEIRQSIIQFQQISRDLRNSKNIWEGTYQVGSEVSGSYIHWSENGGFVWLVVNKCNGGPTKITRGRVLLTGKSVKFIPEKVLISNFFHGNKDEKETYKTKESLFVKWREVNYLIGSDEIDNFTDFTAGLNDETSGFYDEGWYFSKNGQERSGSANELPILPEGYENHIKKPFKAKILSVGKSFRRTKKPEATESEEYLKELVKNYDDLVTEVRLDIGENSNIAPNVFLKFISDSSEEHEYRTNGLRITKVFEDYSIGEYVTEVPKKTCKKDISEDCEAEERKTLKAGLRLSTTAEW